MKIEAIFGNTGQRVVLTAETELEQCLVGAIFETGTDLTVEVEHEGHETNKRARKVTLAVTPPRLA